MKLKNKPEYGTVRTRNRFAWFTTYIVVLNERIWLEWYTDTEVYMKDGVHDDLCPGLMVNEDVWVLTDRRPTI